MKKIVALIPVLSLLLIGCVTFSPYGREGGIIIPVRKPRVEREAPMKRGALLEIRTKDGGYIEGELIAVERNSLLVWEYAEGTDLYVDIESIETITIVKNSKAMLGAGLGGAIGGGLGAIVGAGEKNDSWVSMSKEQNMLMGATIFGALGALVGGSIGAIAGKDETIQIDGKSDSEIKSILEKLRKNARIPNFQ